jgi:hypothetical protein
VLLPVPSPPSNVIKRVINKKNGENDGKMQTAQPGW